MQISKVVKKPLKRFLSVAWLQTNTMINHGVCSKNIELKPQFIVVLTCY